MADEAIPKHRAPTGLGQAGRALWRSLAGIYRFMPHELAILELACRQADDVGRLEELLARDGLVVPGSNRQPRLNAAVTEVRQGRLALGKLLGQLSLPDEEARPMSDASRRAKKAADARWDRTRRLAERRATVALREVPGGDA